MDKNVFLALFAEQFEMSDPSKMTFETHFRELNEWSSLVHLSVIVMLDNELGVQIEEDDFEKLRTVQDLYNYCVKK